MLFDEQELTACAGVTADRSVAEEYVVLLAAAGIQSVVLHAEGVTGPCARWCDPGERSAADDLHLHVHPDDRELVLRSFILPGQELPPEMRDDDPEIAAWLAERAERDAGLDPVSNAERRTAKAVLTGLLTVGAGVVGIRVVGAVLDALSGS